LPDAHRRGYLRQVNAILTRTSTTTTRSGGTGVVYVR